ncbi:MAG: short-chain fatty acid transporter [Bacteroidales bacterium]|jgi:short-chain fatty acids transporter|nr:short-chain fatty acid transporter [Bacteroidales bacterium]MDD3151522.1 short-chain fatty acid transporter [Bacteroidales bacterium]MDD3914825.1 short-chain fatty acid transporter [Bacteroidales bacterium]MDD4634751.1 short-chain fatty acid transporter [Bacteroidales bacterium]
MFRRIINACVKVVQRYLPEPFIFAAILTLIAICIAIPVCHQTPLEVVEHWGDGVWSLLAFAMQMALVLVCGATLAAAPSVKKLIGTLASVPKSPAAAIALVTFVAAIACWINWGFGLIVGVIFAKEVARKVAGIDYRLLIASAYSGFVVWHAGLSASIPLIMATPGSGLKEITRGAIANPVPLSQTIFSYQNIIMVVLCIIALVAVNTLMHPKKGAVTISPALLAEDDTAEAVKTVTPAEKLENSRVLSWIIALLGITYLIIHLFVRGKSLDLNTVIMLFLFVGIILHKTPHAYVKAFTQASTGAAGILLQFPFYAGIMGIIMGVGESGICLGTVVSDACISVSTAKTYPLFTFICAAVLNLFVPSGGGHWAIQAPIMFTAGANLGVDPGLTGMAIAWGDAWTNLIQPFWAIPALSIAKMNAKDIMGFCLIDLVVTGVILCVGLLLWA